MRLVKDRVLTAREIPVRYSLSARQPCALAMQPQKYVAVAREHRPERFRLGWRQRIVCAIAAVVEQQGRKWTAARRTPQLRAERQRTASHVEHLWGTLDWLRRSARRRRQSY